MTLLLQQGADVHAKDKGGLVPLHNACSYGHYEVNSCFVIPLLCFKLYSLLDSCTVTYQLLKSNLFTFGPGGLKFDSRSGQMVHVVAYSLRNFLHLFLYETLQLTPYTHF